MPLTGGARFISTQISAASEMRNAWFARLRGLTFLIVYFHIATMLKQVQFSWSLTL